MAPYIVRIPTGRTGDYDARGLSAYFGSCDHEDIWSLGRSSVRSMKQRAAKLRRCAIIADLVCLDPMMLRWLIERDANPLPARLVEEIVDQRRSKSHPFQSRQFVDFAFNDKEAAFLFKLTWGGAA